MFIVESVCTPRYISGIFADKSKADECLYESVEGVTRVLRRTSVRFPFYVIEEGRQCGNCFRYVNQSQAIRVIQEISRTQDDEHTYLNLYYVCEEFKSRKHGDEMGRLAHYHINNAWLKKYDLCGDSMIAEMR